MKVSILLPFYNAQQDLPACLESIQNQTYQDFEVIAVNDGSVDSSQAIVQLKTQEDSRFRLVNLPSNQGIVAALNIGLEHCQNEWIARIDSDDRMLPSRLEKQVQHIKNHSDVALVGCQVELFTNTPTPPRVGQINHRAWQNSLITNKAIYQEIFVEAPIAHPTFFMSKQCITKLGGYHNALWAEDYDLLLRMWKNKNIMAKVPEVLVKKQLSPNQITATDKRCKRKAMFAAKAHYFQYTNQYKTKNSLYIIGSSKSARLLYKSLANENIQVHGFFDNKPADTNRRIFDTPVFQLTQLTLKQHLTILQSSFLLLVIGNLTARKAVLNLLDSIGLQWGIDYERFL